MAGVKGQRMENRKLSHSLLVLFISAIAFLPFTSSIRASSESDHRLLPNDGPPGALIVARGKHFPASTTGELYWEDGLHLTDVVSDDSGSFEVTFAVPDQPSGMYEVTARIGGVEATDDLEIEGERVPPPAIASSSPVAFPTASPANTSCPEATTRAVNVTNSTELEQALASAEPGEQIMLADGIFAGNFVIDRSGTAEQPIALCGSRHAILDGGSTTGGYALHLTASYWTLHGFSVTNAQKGIVLDGASFNILEQLAVYQIGDEGVHFRSFSSDNIIQDSEVHDTGLRREKFGEGIYIGSAVSNWGKYSNGSEDRSDRNQVLRNRIWNTTAECIDIKEGSTGGLVEGNIFDGSMLSGADSWVDVKGNAYVIRGNTGTNSPTDGFQTHVINNMDWGRDNRFEANVATVNGTGYGFYIHQPDTATNAVLCDNQVSGAEKGFANVDCT
jgi:hypothetical protein